MTHLYAASNMGDELEFGRELGLGRYMVPAYVKVTTDSIDWTLHSDDPVRQQHERDGRIGEAVCWSKRTRGLLTTFLKLTTEDPVAVGRFVRSWGALAPADDTQVNETTGFESLALWRALQSDFRTLIRARTEPARDRTMHLKLARVDGDEPDWLGLVIGASDDFAGYPIEPTRLLRWPRGQLTKARVATMYVEALLAARRPYVVFRDGSGPQVRVTGLSAALALQLGDVLLDRAPDDQTPGRTLAFCTGCNGLVSRRRSPSAGQRVWCEYCKAQAARERQRRHRAKVKGLEQGGRPEEPES